MKTAAFILEEEDIYSEAGANGVTLTLHDLLRHGLTEYNAIVVGKWCHTPFPSAEFIPVRSQKRRDYIDGISSVISKIKAGVIIVPQSFRFALLAKKLRPETPCLLYRHNLVRPKGRISTLLFRSRIKKIDGFIFVSHFIRDHFVRQYPLFEDRCSVAWNGFHTDEWAPRDPESREKLIVFVGRCHPEKGAEESAIAICEVLAKNPEWHAYMALSFPERHPDLYERICHLSRQFPDRFTLATDVKFNAVKQTFEKAAICLVPTRTDEPFGRTAVEGHLGGCCVISSGTGGLREVSGDTAFYLQDTQPRTIAAALQHLMQNPELRNTLAVRGNERVRRMFPIAVTTRQFETALDTTLSRCTHKG